MLSNVSSSNTAPVPLVEARDLSRLADNGDTPLLKPTRFTLNAGAQVAITGPSGSGKSVFLRMLALLDAPTTGEVFWQGKRILSEMIPHYRSCICYLPQRPVLIEGTVLENLKFPFSLKSLQQRTFVERTAADLLLQAGKDLSFLNRRAAELSGGESQIVALVRTLQLSPQAILLDEPTAALDPQSATAVESLVTRWFTAGSGSRAYIWVSHDHDQAHRMSTLRLTMDKGALMPGESA